MKKKKLKTARNNKNNKPLFWIIVIKEQNITMESMYS